MTAIIDGIPAGLKIDVERLNFQLARRQKGYGRGGRMKIESDQVEILSGVRHGITLGSPITLVIPNKDWPNWVGIMHPIKPMSDDLGLKERRLAEETTSPRPGHADLPGGVKYGHKNLRNVLERASARETAVRVAVGSIARQLLEYFNVQFASHVVRIGSVTLEGYDLPDDLARFNDQIELSEVRCADKATEEKMIAAIKAARNERDSLGGVAELIVRGLPIGLGSYAQASRRLDGRLAAALMSIPSVKGVEIGLGFNAAARRGSDVHDQISYAPDSAGSSKKGYLRETNNAGGLEGGVTNGEDLVLRLAAKPISTLNKPLRTVDVVTHEPTEAMVERTDNCVVPSIAVISEAATALVLANAFLEKFGSDNMAEIERNYNAYLNTPF